MALSPQDLQRAQLIGQKEQRGNVIEIPPLPSGFISVIRTTRGHFYAEIIHMISPGMSFVPEAYESNGGKIYRHRNMWLLMEPFVSSGVVEPIWWSKRAEIAINPS